MSEQSPQQRQVYAVVPAGGPRPDHGHLVRLDSADEPLTRRQQQREAQQAKTR